MGTQREGSFNGFSTDTLDFLRNLRANNHKVWFEDHKQDYQNYVLRPLQDLVTDLSSFMLTIDPLLETRPGVDKTISRIYRATRFSKDKSPYKSTIWITFKQPNRNWKDAPVYFLEICPDAYRFGMGVLWLRGSNIRGYWLGTSLWNCKTGINERTFIWYAIERLTTGFLAGS